MQINESAYRLIGVYANQQECIQVNDSACYKMKVHAIQ